jgi:hypothetical protein
MHDPDPETVDYMLTALGGHLERMIKALRIAQECEWLAEKAAIRRDLELAHDHLLLVLCAVPDDAPRREVAAMLTKIEKALGTPS